MTENIGFQGVEHQGDSVNNINIRKQSYLFIQRKLDQDQIAEHDNTRDRKMKIEKPDTPSQEFKRFDENPDNQVQGGLTNKQK